MSNKKQQKDWYRAVSAPTNILKKPPAEGEKNKPKKNLEISALIRT